ncbi:MAG: hypothetical protein ABL930_02005 [Pseudobdellovibrio sp.]
MKSNTYVLIFLLLGSLLCSSLKAQETPVEEPEEAPKTVAIQNRPYILNKEIGVYYSYMPLDHFNHFHAFGANYLNYFNDYLAWEVFNAATVTKQSTGLADRLLNDFGAVPDTFDILQYYFTSSVIYTPIYMKHLYKNKEIRFGDISFVAGAGVARFEKALNANMVEAGFITRFIGQEGLNFKFDVRYKTFLSGNLRPNISIGLVFTYNFTEEVQNKQALDEE